MAEQNKYINVLSELRMESLISLGYIYRERQNCK